MEAVKWLEKEIKKFNTVITKEYLLVIIEKAKAMDEEQNNAKIQKAIEKFEEAKSKASSLKDIIYLDGVLAVLDTIKNETFKSE